MQSATAAIGTAAVKSQVNNAIKTATSSKSDKATGYLGPYCSKYCCEGGCLGFSIGNVVRLSLLAAMIFFLFIAMCTSKLKTFKYNTGSGDTYDCYCTHTQKLVCSPGAIDRKFKDLDSNIASLICKDGADAGSNGNFKAAQAFIGCTAFAWLCMLVNIPILVAMDRPFGPFETVAFLKENIYYVNLAWGVWIWIFLTSNWGSWNAQECCGTGSATSDQGTGAAFSIAIFVWILDLFYLAFCIPDVEEILFGEK